MKISWTPTARRKYNEILEYLVDNWTEKELISFIDEVESLLRNIQSYPEMFEASKKKKNVRKGLITKHKTLYYRIKPKKKELELITFWDNRDDPNRLVY